MTIGEPRDQVALALFGADRLQALGRTGEGIKIAVIDTGVNPLLPTFGNGFGPGFPIYKWIDLVNGEPAPVDQAGHGTAIAHCILQVAPGAQLFVIRAREKEEDDQIPGDRLLEALELAVAEGARIINVPTHIGTNCGEWPNNPSAMAATSAAQKGILVVVAGGNAGLNPGGHFLTQSPAVGRKVIAAAAARRLERSLPTAIVNPSRKVIQYLPILGTPDPVATTTGEIVSVGTGCGATLPANPAGKWALADASAACLLPTDRIYPRLVQAGAIGVILSSTKALLGSGFLPLGVVNGPIPYVNILFEDALHIRNAPGSTLTFTGDRTPNDLREISVQSSIGPSPANESETGPGLYARVACTSGGITIGRVGELRLFGGGSQASAHIAGCCALLLEQSPNLKVDEVIRRLQNSAEPLLLGLAPLTRQLESVYRQGAGLVQVDLSASATTLLDPSQISLGEFADGATKTQVLTIENRADTEVSYVFSDLPAAATAGTTGPITFPTGSGSVGFAPSTVLVPAHGSVAVEVTIAPSPDWPDRTFFGGYIVATDPGGRKYRVPYGGFKGDYQSIPAMTPTTLNFPHLAKKKPNPIFIDYEPQPNGATFTFLGDDIPYFLVHLDIPVGRLRAEVRDADTGKSWHRAFDLQYLPRDSGPKMFTARPWDGKTKGGAKQYTVPNGRYVVRLLVQKPLAPDLTTDSPGGLPVGSGWEEWLSPVITVSRP